MLKAVKLRSGGERDAPKPAPPPPADPSDKGGLFAEIAKRKNDPLAGLRKVRRSSAVARGGGAGGPDAPAPAPKPAPSRAPKAPMSFADELSSKLKGRR